MRGAAEASDRSFFAAEGRLSRFLRAFLGRSTGTSSSTATAVVSPAASAAGWIVEAAIAARADFALSVMTCVPPGALLPLVLPLPDDDCRGRRPPDEPFDGAALRCLTTGSWCTMTPRPAQTSQGSLKVSRRPRPSFLRVICTRPSEVTSATWCLVRSRLRHSMSRRSTRSRFDSSTMSMKSTTMMPPMSRSRS